jgi:threonine dehydrogenase-like Zn-dependent dehydrogenase
MRALQITAPGRFEFSQIALPKPSPGEVLLQVKRVGYCGSDLSTFRGLNPLVSYPRIPGHEVAAVIVETTEGVPSELRPGLAVTVMPYTACGRCSSCRKGRANACQHNQTLGVQRDGALTEFIAVPWKKIFPARLQFRDLALIEPLSVGFHAVSRGRVAGIDVVLVLGCGMIGLGAIAAAGLHRGARVIAVDIEDDKLMLAKRAGATDTINSRTEKLRERIQEITGDGPDVAIEAVGTPLTYQAAVNEAAFSGRVVYIGYNKAAVDYDTKWFVMKELDILGSRNATEGDFSDVLELLLGGRYPCAETVTRTVPWSQAGEALQSWAENPGAITKIHVEVG